MMYVGHICGFMQKNLLLCEKVMCLLILINW